MGIGTGVPGEDFSARVIFRAPGIVDQRWAVTHEFSSNVGATEDGSFRDFADSLAVFHLNLLMPAFFVERVVLSTLAADSAPYDPTTLAVYEYNTAGQRSADGDIIPLANVVLVKRLVPNGRLGSMLLRGMLTEADISSPGGVPQITSISAMQVEVSDVVDAQLAPYLSAAATDLQLYMITLGLLDNTERAISGYLVKSLTNKKLNNKYFDRP
jgi:hypothetical protein